MAEFPAQTHDRLYELLDQVERDLKEGKLGSLDEFLSCAEIRAPKYRNEGTFYKRFFALMGLLHTRRQENEEIVSFEVWGKFLDILNYFGREVGLVRGPCLDTDSIYRDIIRELSKGKRFDDLLQGRLFVDEDPVTPLNGPASIRERNLIQGIQAWRLSLLAADHLGVIPNHFKRGSRYFVVGCSPEMKTISDHFNYHEQFPQFIDEARKQVEFILVADEAGIFHALRHSNCPDPERTHGDWLDSLDEREISEANGLQLQFFLQAIQQVALGSRAFFEEVLEAYDGNLIFDNEYKSIIRTSELLALEKQKVRQIFEILFDKIKYTETCDEKGVAKKGPQDKRLAELLWRCVPVNIRIAQFGEDLGKKNYRDFSKAIQKMENSEDACKYWHIFSQMMVYGLYQTATTLYLGGTKVGFEGEKKFDAVAQHCAEKYADELDLDEVSRELKFRYISPKKGLDQLPAPYIPDPLGSSEAPTLSIHQADQKLDTQNALLGFIKEKLPIYECFLRNIERSLYFKKGHKDSRARDCMLDVEIFKLIRDLAMELSREPALFKVLEASGIISVLGVKNYTLLKNLNTIDTTIPLKPEFLDKKIRDKFEEGRQKRRHVLRAFMENKTPQSFAIGVQNRTGELHIDDIDMGDKFRRGLHDFKERDGEFGSFYLMRHLANVLSGPLQFSPELIQPIRKIMGTLLEVMYPGSSESIDLSQPQWDYNTWLTSQKLTE